MNLPLHCLRTDCQKKMFNLYESGTNTITCDCIKKTVVIFTLESKKSINILG